MSDPELVYNILTNIETAIARIERRFVGIDEPNDFVLDTFGVDRLDGITMMLIAMGEQLKRLDTLLDFEMSARYPDVDWKGAKGVRDFLSHHYFSVDAEVIFDICENKLAGLKRALLDMKRNIGTSPTGDKKG